MIDIHCHILPGLDDGAQTIEDSLAMARAAVNDGITKIVATPHHQTSRFMNPKNVVLKKVAYVNEAIEQAGLPLEILPGQEVRLFGEWEAEFDANQLATVNNGNYILIEFPSNHVPNYAERLFYEMQMKGLTPVIVHPERNSQIVQQPEKLYTLIEKGAISQVTASSVAGDLGKKLQKFSFQLIEANLTHCVASDAHNTTIRPFMMSKAYDVIEKEFGIDVVYMFRENAEYIIDSQMIYREDPQQVKRKKILGLF